MASQHNSGTPLSVTSFTTSGGSLTKDIWVEGISPQSEPRKTKLKLTYDKAQGFSDEAALTVIGVEEVEWKAIGDQIIEKDPNWPAGLSPQGWRVFPDKYTPEEAAASHEKVDVSVKLSVSPPFPIKLFLRAFDVDDPSYTDGIITDNFGSLVMNDEGLERDNVYPNNSAEPDWQKQNPTCGKFEGFNISFNIKELDLLPENKTYSAVFCLSPCPGDNFRIVANGDKSFLEQLENNDTLLNIGSTVSEKLQNLQRIVDPMATGVPSGSPSVQEVRVSEKYCSRTLTTWRKLWIERDSMSPIPEEKRWVQGIVERYSVRNLSDVNGNSYSRFTGTMYDAYEGRPPSKDAFEGGELYFKIWSSNNEYYLMGAENGGPFYITRSNKLFYNSFEIWPALSASQLAVIQEIHSNAGNVFYKAKDDADYTVFDQKQILSIDSLKEAYYEAYIDPVYADEFNDKKIQPYIREVSLYSLMGALNLSRDLTSSIWMWTTHVVASFEGVYLKDADLDPDDCMSDKINNGVPPYLGAADVKLGSDAELFGLAFSLNNNSALFLETIRDARYDAKTEPSLTTTNLTVHEITHVGGIGIGHFNGDDGIHGVLVPNLMFKDPQIINQSTRFRAQTIRSLRKIEKW